MSQDTMFVYYIDELKLLESDENQAVRNPGKETTGFQNVR